MSNSAAIIGAGGHARAVISLAEDLGISITGIYDDNFETEDREYISGYSLMGDLTSLEQLGNAVLLAIGDNDKRATLFKRFENKVLHAPSIHPQAHVDKTAKLGKANLVFARAIVARDVQLGDNNIINTGCIVEHECQIGSHNHISIGAILAGRTKIGDHCFIGAGTVVIDGVTIGNRINFGAGTVVVKDIMEPGTYVGNPAKKIR